MPSSVTSPNGRGRGIYIMSLGVHGLVRASNLELGRDADTGGQTAYMVDQARALGAHPRISRVDLVTRRIRDQRVDAIYEKESETISDGARIVRIASGSRRYLHKESLWPYLDGFVDELLRFIRASRHAPDVIHGHYADAGYVGNQLARIIGVPFVFTAHSLGRVKRARLIEDGGDPEVLEQRYHLRQRIEAEERALETASLVITSTNQEVEQQYQLYDHYQPERMEVIPPGVDLSRFSPPGEDWSDSRVRPKIEPFLRNPDKPAVLAIARADERKNFQTLLRAFAETPGLSETANLIMVMGQRKDLADLDRGARKVLMEILRLVDRYDLYGSVAYPKEFTAEGIVDLYRFATRTRGVFVNPALTEPFGLTLIEAAACGVPIIATSDGGPRDIIQVCENGVLVDPLDAARMGQAILSALKSPDTWSGWSENGLSRVRHFSWANHAERYLSTLEGLLRESASPEPRRPSRLPAIDRAVIADLDDTLTGDDAALERLGERLQGAGERVGFFIFTGRSLDSARPVLESLPLPPPDIVVTGSGTDIRYGWPRLIPDQSWIRHIDFQWDPERVREILRGIEGVKARPQGRAGRFRVACRLDPERAPSAQRIRRLLRQQGLRVSVVLDRKVYLDVLPMRASPGLALRFLSYKLDLPLERVMVAGDSRNDLELLSGNTLGVVVANHTPALKILKQRSRVYFARGRHAEGVIEGIDHYDFLGEVRVPALEATE